MNQSDSGNNPPPTPEASNLTLQAVTVTAQDLPLHCPSDKAPLWSMHPRSFLDIAKTGTVKCPYCSTLYTLAPGTVVPGHRH